MAAIRIDMAAIRPLCWGHVTEPRMKARFPAMATHIQSQPAVRSTLLRRTLQADAIFSGLSGVALVAAAGPIGTLLGLNAPIALAALGVALIGYAALLFATAAKEPIDRRRAIVAAVLDVIWVVDSAIVLVSGWLPLTPTGWWIVLDVAIVVAVFAELKFMGLWRLGREAR